MGIDWKLVTSDGDTEHFMRYWSSNFSQLREEYGLHTEDIHNHTSMEVIYAILRCIEKMQPQQHDFFIYTDEQYKQEIEWSPNFHFGTDSSGKPLPDYVRRGILYYQLRKYIQMALAYPSAMWENNG